MPRYFHFKPWLQSLQLQRLRVKEAPAQNPFQRFHMDGKQTYILRYLPKEVP